MKDKVNVKVASQLSISDSGDFVRSLEVSINDASLSVIVDEETGELRIRANSDSLEYTGRLLVVPHSPNVVLVKLEKREEITSVSQEAS